MSAIHQEHERVIFSFLKHLNEQSENFILKGGTALLACYGLDRFSEDIDLDGVHGKGEDIKSIVESFCKENNYSFRTAKETATVKRYMINYGETGKPLKVETSFRRVEIAPEEVRKKNGIMVYDIDTLCMMKSSAYAGRDKIRDLYDLSFICNKHHDSLSAQTIAFARNAVEHKGIEQFDYIVRQQEDALIDKDKLASDFLLMYEKLGLLYDEREKSIVQSLQEKPSLESQLNAAAEVIGNTPTSESIEHSTSRDEEERQ